MSATDTIDSKISEYSKFNQDNYPISDAEMEWMQDLCTDVKSRIGPLPVNIDKNQHEYLPFLHQMLRDIEEFNNEQQQQLHQQQDGSNGDNDNKGEEQQHDKNNKKKKKKKNDKRKTKQAEERKM